MGAADVAIVILGIGFVVALIFVFAKLIHLDNRDIDAEEARLKLSNENRSYIISNGFEITKEVIDPDRTFALRIDSVHKKWSIEIISEDICKIYNFADYLRYDIIKDNQSLLSGNSGDVVLGGLLFGGIGALAGAAGSKKISNVCSSMSVVIYVNDIENPYYTLKIIESEMTTDSLMYKECAEKATELAALLEYIKAQTQTSTHEPQSEASSDPITEIERLHSLMEKGMITEEEYNAKKKQLLNL